MITVPELAAEALSSFLASDMKQRFGSSHNSLNELVPSMARVALECIGNSDALYHDVEHTVLVTLVGHEIMKGRALLEPVDPADYAHFIIACLLHDIGYVRGILKEDTGDEVVVDAEGRRIRLPRGSSDAALARYHVDRSKLFVLARMSSVDGLDAGRIARAIECTRFPVSDSEGDEDLNEEGRLVRAADMIGQLGDPRYLRKARALFHELEEIGLNRQLGYSSPADLVDLYSEFYWSSIAPYVQPAFRYLDVSASGRQWIANLYSNVFRAEQPLRSSQPSPAILSPAVV
ncbi:MAG: metal-dependent phosphohydrolase [Hyphomicrobiales bacterium]|nr:metal-dependent phosphohydrolase [Hyphomicrobiales bacterium]